MEEGGVGIENTILFGKYQLGPIIGQGRSGTVYLATHKELQERRAIKRVPKTFVEYEQFKREALLLKELRHPGIPIVYDLEEDLEYSYLIEEYLEGDSLYDLVKSHGPLSQEAVIRYGIQICDLVNYLHFAEETPILYLDLQPKNLLLCHEIVKLIDFDHAKTLEDANEATKRYGTLGCCAPEQMDTSLSLDIRTDVYAIGSVLCFMRTGTYPRDWEKETAVFGKNQLEKVIRICLSPHKEFRYQSAEKVRQALEEIEKQTQKHKKIHKKRMDVFRNNSISSLTIALIGSKSGVGTTHLSLSLSSYLKQIGYPNLYEEHNQSGAVRQMAWYGDSKLDSYGILQFKQLLLKPWYGEAVRLKEHPYKFVIRDYGTDWELLKNEHDVDVVLLVCSCTWWDNFHLESAIKKLQDGTTLLLVYNHPMSTVPIKAPRGLSRDQCFQIPYFESPFHVEKKVFSCWQAIIKKSVVTEKRGRPVRRFLRKTAGMICRKIGLSE